jgi:RNA polymerase sigma-70 factor (ECF subfamily)
MNSTKEEFLEILSNYQGILHKVSIIYFKNASDRVDNFQEIVYQLWKSYSKLQNRNSIGSWIYAVSINTSISRIKIKKISRIEYRETLPDIPDSSDIFDELSKNESLKLLLSAIYELDEIDRSIMLLYLDEKSYHEIADIIGISKSNVGVRISRAKESLKQNIKN